VQLIRRISCDAGPAQAHLAAGVGGAAEETEKRRRRLHGAVRFDTRTPSARGVPSRDAGRRRRLLGPVEPVGRRSLRGSRTGSWPTRASADERGRRRGLCRSGPPRTRAVPTRASADDLHSEERGDAFLRIDRCGRQNVSRVWMSRWRMFSATQSTAGDVFWVCVSALEIV